MACGYNGVPCPPPPPSCHDLHDCGNLPYTGLDLWTLAAAIAVVLVLGLTLRLAARDR